MVPQSRHTMSPTGVPNLTYGLANDTSSSLEQNASWADANATSSPEFLIHINVVEACIAIALIFFILIILIGNTFVILSVALFREMRTMTNGLIVSLASADLLLAFFVLPLSLHHEIAGAWTLGRYVCEFWVTSDVFCCTASILNIVVIAVDRYWLITRNVRYTHNTTFPRKRVCFVLLALAWIAAGIISSSPLFGWRSGHEHSNPGQCMVSQDLGYTVFSTFGAFWFPLVVILLVYFKIFKIARNRAKMRAKARAIHPSVNSTVFSEVNGKSHRYSRPSDSNSPQASPRVKRRLNSSERSRRMRSRTRSSARTLGLIIGGFILCWLPFFILATILPFCAKCEVPPIVMSVVLWLGYSNSLLNPAIYAIWDKNFRRSFKRLSRCDIRWSVVL